MNLQRVDTTPSQDAFFQVPYRIYRDDPNWIPPLQRDLSFIFDEQRNPAFQDGALQRWVLLDDEGRPAGRIAAFTKSESIRNEPYRVGGIGFFECIHDQNSAFQLFDAAKQWLEERGIEAMDGPINFGERDKFWGLLVDGFKQPSYQENYNPPYYQELFEAYGFRQYFGQETFEAQKGEVQLDRLRKIAERTSKHEEFAVRTLDLNRLDQYVADFVTIYNRAWENFKDFKPLSREEVKALFKQVKPILEKDFLIFIYLNGYPAGVVFMLPDVNQIFQYFNGKMGLWEQLKFLWYRQRKVMNKLKGVVLGIHPDFQNKGVDALLIYNLLLQVEQNGQYHYAELSWIGDFNPKMKATMQKLNAKRSKLHLTYRKLFHEHLTFEPYRIN